MGIAGATGYAGRELIRLLSSHPLTRLVHLASSGREGRAVIPLEKTHPNLRGRSKLACNPLRLEDFESSEMDLVFLSTPPEVSLDLAPALIERGLKVVDLSGAFRLKNPEAYPPWYGFKHTAPQALDEAVYGVTELNGEAIAKARLVANPGCFATSVILALAPLLRAGWVDLRPGIVCDSKSGASGAGRTPGEKLHFPEVNENCRAYNVFRHRHVPEMLQALELEGKQFTFAPHLLPVTRGILSTIYLRLAEPRTPDELVSLYRAFYACAPLVRVYDDGTLPEIQAVACTNYADLGFVVDSATGSDRLALVSALDNLGKGAAGQAIQNMNLMNGWAQEIGLE